ncbi:MAG: ribonuclease [Pontixanthobacter sp.]
MAEFYAEEGIGETRIVQVENGRIVAAKLDWHEELTVGARVVARITQRKRQDDRALLQTNEGAAIWARDLPSSASEGSEVTVEIVRAPIREDGRGKPATGRYTDEPPRSFSAIGRIRATGENVRMVHRFPVDGWDDIVEIAASGQVAFDGGSLILHPTPAMTLIDIDGHLPPRELALAAVPAIADTLHRIELYGSIGIDFPTLNTKADRKIVDTALANALSNYPHERTAMNGFGFVQLVARLEGPSILHRFAASRTGAHARLLLRQAEMVEDHGMLLLTCHPAIAAKLKPKWIDELGRRMGRELRVSSDPGLALDGGFAQAVPQ